MRRFTLRRGLTWGGVLISLLFTYFAFHDIDLHQARAALVSSEYWVLAPALLVLAVAIFVRAVRWRLLFPPEHRPATGIATSAMLVGYLFNAILPARAGEAARIVVLNRRAGTSRFEALGTVVAERALDVLVLLAIFLASAPVLPNADLLPNALGLSAVLFIGIAALSVVFALWGGRPARYLLRPLSLWPTMSRERTDLAAANLVRGCALFRHASIALPATALTVASWLLISLAFWICMHGFHLGLGFEAALLVVISINLAMVIPSGPAAVGVFEAATLVALLPFDVDRSTALSYALVLHALNFIPLIVAGYVVLHYHALAVRRTGSHQEAEGLTPSERAAPLV
jgi:glycosyltransferase 2 family protein